SIYYQAPLDSQDLPRSSLRFRLAHDSAVGAPPPCFLFSCKIFVGIPNGYNSEKNARTKGKEKNLHSIINKTVVILYLFVRTVYIC
ncbi:MAG: hypothetical protein K0R02_943, partial [Rickettsiaceae bacterium]|nr:hypothetical protein [Rickettsiaceae bacterium]